MIDIRCHRCGQKIGWRMPDGAGVVIRCDCGAKNIVGLELFCMKGLDSTLSLGVTIAMTTA